MLPKYGAHPLYRHVCAVGAVANILLMMTANLVGFVLGLEGTKHLLHELTSTVSGASSSSNDIKSDLYSLCVRMVFHVICELMFVYRRASHV